jgi:hypothetical protein
VVAVVSGLAGPILRQQFSVSQLLALLAVLAGAQPPSESKIMWRKDLRLQVALPIGSAVDTAWWFGYSGIANPNSANAWHSDW